MKKHLFAVLPLVVVSAAIAGYAGTVITTDDLDRKYPAEDTSVEETLRLQDQRLQHERECEALKQSMAQARSAVHEETQDRGTYAERAELYYRIKTEYANKCAAP